MVGLMISLIFINIILSLYKDILSSPPIPSGKWIGDKDNAVLNITNEKGTRPNSFKGKWIQPHFSAGFEYDKDHNFYFITSNASFIIFKNFI